jgi:hypothetical protein
MRRLIMLVVVALVMAAMMVAMAMPAFAGGATVFIPSEGCENEQHSQEPEFTPFMPQANLQCSPTTPPQKPPVIPPQ